MRVFVAGSTGQTGRHLVQMLLEKGEDVVAVTRSKEKLLGLLPAATKDKFQDRLSIHEAAIMDCSNDQLADYTKGCDAVVSCLGHNPTMDGLFGKKEAQLVTDSTQRLTSVMPAQSKYLLMGTGMVRLKKDAPRSWGARLTLGLLSTVLPPHVDNETAAAYLQGKPDVNWCIVRPTNLIDGDATGIYEISDTIDTPYLAVKDQVTRANVAHFMVELLQDKDKWETYKHGLPYIRDPPLN